MTTSTLRKFAPIILVAFVLSGCQSTYQSMADNPKTTTGAALGAAGGGLIAAAAGGGAAGIIGGVLIGGLLGGAIGNALDQRDKDLALRANQQALESNRTGQTSSWHNPDSGHSGTFTPTSTYQNSAGQNCREGRQTVKIGDETHEAIETYCRQPDGSWRAVQ
ncbi:MAG: hypothetical protein V3U03_00965 [Myxococcota bacterium]